MEGTVKFCENCGAQLQPGQKFCDNCGQKIVYSDALAAAPVPAEKPQQAQGFPEKPKPYAGGSAQQGNAYQQNSYQQNNYQQNSHQQGAGRQSSNAVLPPRLGCVIAYLFSMLGCIALYFLGDREDDFVRHHLNQAVVLAILQIVTRILDLDGLLETIVNLFIFFGWIVGMYGSVSGKKTEIPLISQVKIF